MNANKLNCFAFYLHLTSLSNTANFLEHGHHQAQHFDSHQTTTATTTAATATTATVASNSADVLQDLGHTNILDAARH